MPGFHRFDEEDLQAVKAVLDSGNLSATGTGGQSDRLEQEFAAEFGSSLGLTTVNAMAGLHAAVASSGAGLGDEIICDPMVIFGALAVMYHNAIPVFADVDIDTHLVDPASVEAAITERTKGIIVTHLWGLMADMPALVEIANRHGLTLIEDCSHAIYATCDGKYAGTFGDVGVFSFQMAQQMAVGDGGLALMRDVERRRAMSEFCNFGTCPSRLSWNYRMNEVVAAIARVQLKRARGYVDQCVENAGLLTEAVQGYEALLKPQVSPDPKSRTSSYHMWAARYDGDKAGVPKHEFINACADEAIGLNFGYLGQPAYKQDVIRNQVGYGQGCPRDCSLAGRKIDYGADLCPNAEYLMPRLILGSTAGPREEYEQKAEKLRAICEGFG
ncbi:MAG: DegT/DnrJ/EryC1/StrS family aminotransferase [Armatimonadota bacterium]